MFAANSLVRLPTSGTAGGMDETTRLQGQELARLLDREHIPVAITGDRVIVAAGLLGRGFPWDRRECTVKEVRRETVLLSFGTLPNYIGGGPDEQWARRELVVEIIGDNSSDAEKS